MPTLTIKQLATPGGFGLMSGAELWQAVEQVNAVELKQALRPLDYPSFLRTPYWLAVSDKVKANAGRKCQLCNSPSHLQAHHRSYEHRCEEHLFLGDLTCLCDNCHGAYHGQKTQKKHMTEAKVLVAVLQGELARRKKHDSRHNRRVRRVARTLGIPYYEAAELPHDKFQQGYRLFLKKKQLAAQERRNKKAMAFTTP